VELGGVFASGAFVQIMNLVGNRCERSKMNFEVALAQELLRDGESHIALAQFAVCEEQDIQSRRSHGDQPKSSASSKKYKRGVANNCAGAHAL
jgi:hypothetical protein